MNITLFKPFPYQKEVINNLTEHWSDSIHILKSKRQIGKSILDANLLIYCSLKQPNQTSVIISPTLGQARKVFKDITKWMKGSNTISNANASLLEIEFINGSIIYFKSAEQRDSLRGYTVSSGGLLIIDEAAYINDDVISMTLPFVDANHSPIVLTSTPRFRQGFFYTWYTKGINHEGNIHVVDVNNYDTSNLLSKEKLKFYRSQLPTQIFRSDYLGEFLDENSDVFGDFSDIVSNNYNPDNKIFYMGIDWGTGDNQDFTAISTFNSDFEMVDIDYFNDKSPIESITYILDKISKFRPKRVTVEKNSIGSIYFDMLASGLKQHKLHLTTELKSFVTTNESKRKIIEGLASNIQQGNIQLLDNPELKIELAAYQIQKTKSGGITYNAASGYHDDLIISTSICLQSMIHKSYNASNIAFV